MTEAAYQAARKVMQRANYMRGQITESKGNVAKWSRIVDDLRDKGRATTKAEETLEKTKTRLREREAKFAALQFPDVNLTTEVHRCKECGRKLRLDELCICIYQ